MNKILVTGATGNVGESVVKSLYELNCEAQVVAGVRNRDDISRLHQYDVALTKFDFTDSSTFEPALQNCDKLFLLRPPQISQVDKYFKPLITLAKHVGVRHIVFLSVQGVDKSSFIPHHKIEALIRQSKVPFTFLRPGYFMQNFTTTFRAELVNDNRIFLPAGKARFTVIDVRDIGAVAAKVLCDAENYKNLSFDLTGTEILSFEEMAEKLTSLLGRKIQYQSPNLLHFFLSKRKEKFPLSFILVMMALHYLPRFAEQPPITDWVTKITGRKPLTFEKFIEENRALLSSI
jgi:uncharacterized protein YbjT (DUF2867 family)